MLENLHEGAIVKLTLRDKSIEEDVVERIERDGSVVFTGIGYRHGSGQVEFDCLNKKDVIECEIIGAMGVEELEAHMKNNNSAEPDEKDAVIAKLQSDCAALTEALNGKDEVIAKQESEFAALAESLTEKEQQIVVLNQTIEALTDQIEQLTSDAPAEESAEPVAETKKSKKKAEENADNTTEKASDSQETGTAEA